MFKKALLVFLLCLLTVSNLTGAMFSKKASAPILLAQDSVGKQWCPVCGMKIKDYYKTSYIAKLKMNGSKRQYCSIRCLAVDMQEYGIDTSSIVAVDAKTEKLINAQDAFYVVGSKISGTMSKVSKLAFAKQGDAKDFIKKHKGELTTFEVALKMAQDSLKSDIAMVKKKKKKKVYPRGEKIYKKVCKAEEIDPTDYLEINELKDDIVSSKLCKPLKEKDLQAVSLYIWEVKRFGDLGNIEDKVQVREDEKCPVCGMFTYKYPRWAAQIFYKHGDHEHHWSFDGVKDLMKFYFNSAKWGNYPIAKRENIAKILVTDYYTQKGIDGTKAYYVIRSDIYGPMGHELIPFELESDAQTFKKDHFGKRIIKFSNIIEDEVYQLDFNE